MCLARQRAFLAVYRKTACISIASWAAKIGRRRHYHWLERDPDYVQAFKEASQWAFDELRDEAVRRGVEGWLEPVYYKGRKIGAKRRYSDKLLMCLLELADPEKYGQARHSSDKRAHLNGGRKHP
jgi:hypothetical protein